MNSTPGMRPGILIGGQSTYTPSIGSRQVPRRALGIAVAALLAAGSIAARSPAADAQSSPSSAADHALHSEITVLRPMPLPVLATQLPPPSDDTTAAPQPGSTLVVSLVTIGVGDYLWEKFGHNALRVRDTRTGLDTLFNWGMFDFEEDGFVLRFLRGDMRYWMQADPSTPFLRYYASHDRQMWEQLLNFSDAQKAEIFRLALENTLPENRFYAYNYYLDNCSTRIRDLINRVVGGQLESATDSVMTATSYRSHTRRLLRDDILAYTGIQLVLGHPADAPISRWDEMFLPVRMMQHLADVRVTGADGISVPLIGATAELHSTRTRAPEAEVAVPHTWGYLVAGIAVALLLMLLASAGSRGSAVGTKGFIAMAITWCVMAGLAGTIALGMWLFTAHTFMYRNETIFLMNPLHLVLAFLMSGAALHSHRVRGAVVIASAITVLSGIAGLLYLMPDVGQENIEMVVLAIPPNLALLAGLGILLGRHRHPHSASMRAA